MSREVESTSSETPPNRRDASSPRRLPVRSSFGVPLRRVEVSKDGTQWNDRSLREGHVRIHEDVPVFVRAAGHVEQLVAVDAKSIVLDPELAFVLHAPGLSGALREAKVDVRSSNDRHQRFASHGLLDNERYAFAISASYGHKVFSDVIGLELRFHDHSALRLEPDLRARGTHRIDIAEWVPISPGRPLKVNAHCFHSGESFEVLITASNSEVRPSRALVASDAWGRLESLQQWRVARVTGPCNRDLDLGTVPADRAQLVEARCESGCRGRTMVFVEDPEEVVTLDLIAVPILRGTALAASGSRHPDTLVVDYALTDSPDFASRDDAAWRSTTREHLILGIPEMFDDHRFGIVLAESEPTDRIEHWTVPRYAHVAFRPVGFEPQDLTVDLSDVQIHDMGTLKFITKDLGTLYFEEIEPDLVITGDHKVADHWVVGEGLEIHLSGESALAVGAESDRSSDDILLFLGEDAGARAALERWRALPQAYAMLSRGTWSAYHFQRVDDHALTRLSTAHVSCNVTVRRDPPDHGAFYLGYRWNGMDHVWTRSGHEDVGVGYTVQFTVPAGPLDVWWNTEPVAPDADQGGWGEFVDGRAELVIE